MELRDIEIFLTLAEELHFGRTAERLRVTPARVSQSIKKQERHIGAPLFDRTSRAVRLTPLGERLHRELGAGYRQVREAVEAAVATVHGTTGTLTLGTMGAMSLAAGDLLDHFRNRYPGARLLLREIHPPDPFTPLRTGEVDVGLMWLPVREPDLSVGPVVHSSPVVLVTSAEHPYAQRESICCEDLAECTFLAPRGPIPSYMEEAINPFRTPSGRPIPRGPRVASFQEILTTVSSGAAVVPVQVEAARFYPWPSLAFVPIRDFPPSQWVFVWRTAAETPLIRAFVQAAADYTDGCT